MENPEEVLHCLEEFSKSKPTDIPRELEDYLCFVAKTGDPVYQWSIIKSLFREKMVRVITEFYEACPSVEIPPCPNVDIFNYDVMKNFILEKLETFAAAPFTVQRLCELLTTPRKEYNRIDKYMRALEKNILVVSTTEPNGGRRNNTENGEGIVNGLENDHLPETSNSSNNDINVEEMDDTPPSSSSWPKTSQNETQSQQQTDNDNNENKQESIQETVVDESKTIECSSSTQESVITCRNNDENLITVDTNQLDTCEREEDTDNSDVTVTITAVPAGVQKRRNSIEPVVSSESEQITEESITTTTTTTDKENSNNIIDDNTKEDKDIIDETPTSIEEIKDADSSTNIEIVNETEIEKIEETNPIKMENNEVKIEEKPDNVAATTCSETIKESSNQSCINNEITSSDKSISDDKDIINDVSVEKSLNDNVDSEVDNKNDKDDNSKEVSSTPMDVDNNDDDDDDDDNGDKTEIVDKVETTSESTL